MTNAKNTPPRAFGSAPPPAGQPLAAYRSALAKVEPGEAFLARTRQALAGGSAAQAPHRMTGTAAQDRPLRRARLTPLQRGLLPAACLALLLLALPAGRLLRGGGVSLSGGAAAQAADEAMSVTSSAAVAEDTTAEDYTVPAGEEPAAAPEAGEGPAADAAPQPAATEPAPAADHGATPDEDGYSGIGGMTPESDGTEKISGNSRETDNASAEDRETGSGNTAPTEYDGQEGAMANDLPEPGKLAAGRARGNTLNVRAA